MAAQRISRKMLYLIMVAILFACSSVVFYRTVLAQYSGSGNHQISLADAQRYIRNFTQNPSVSGINALYYERNIFDKILAQPGCVGIRQYFAKTDAAAATLVLVGVDAAGHDMADGIIGELGYPCPPYCDNTTPLLK